MNIFGTLSASAVATNVLMNQVAGFYNKKIVQAGRAITDQYALKLHSLEREGGKWRDMEKELLKARSVVSDTIGRVRSLRRTLDSLMLTVQKADGDPQIDIFSKGYAKAFDSMVKGLKSTAERTRDMANLIGREGVRSLSYPTNIYWATDSVPQSYLGTDYYITDANGERWQPNRATRVLQHYEAYPGDTSGRMGSYDDGIRVDSLSGDAITYTVGLGTAAEETISGTITREGIEVLDSWIYDGLASAAGRARALEDLQAAKEALDLEIRRYEIAESTINFHAGRSRLAIKVFRSDSNDLMIEQATAIHKAKGDMERQYHASQMRLAGAMAIRGQYATLLFVPKNSVMQTLIDLHA